MLALTSILSVYSSFICSHTLHRWAGKRLCTLSAEVVAWHLVLHFKYSKSLVSALIHAVGET